MKCGSTDAAWQSYSKMMVDGGEEQIIYLIQHEYNNSFFGNFLFARRNLGDTQSPSFQQ
jgi:hypothetical protein